MLALVLTIIFGIILIGTTLLLGFTIAVFFGAPFLPTMGSQRQTALELLDLKPGQKFYDLGCGDGRMLRSAAQTGLTAVGYEINPILVIIARIVNWRYRQQVRVVLGNYWRADFSDADGIYVFLLENYMPKLDRKIAAMKKPLKLASYTFQIKGKRPVKKKNAVFLYQY